MADWIKTHKFSIIYFVSFFLYPFIPLLIYPLGDYGAVAVAVLIFLFQLSYIIWLRRKENVSLGRSIARFFLYLLAMPNVWFAWSYIDIFNNGYTYWSLFNYVGDTYYGFEAWEKSIFERSVFGLFFIVFAVYLALYLVISAAIRRSQAKK